MLQKGEFKWSKESLRAFEELKVPMSSTIVLIMPDFSKSFILETNACDVGIRAILM